ncbi:MAG: Glycosyl transferase group 1 [Candidatus Amesbacteria bacterium GW2011_GWC2_47_8]|uniref:Glycosyl transferase group 1 n=1 Tax=Candidatus Amesbacteria bacterium GW2011_GWC2_47_8 TaxID=1618367 RepID=A0A0G1W0G5_9BACT|nr:MAG: Glycosyl transferase group 1 [Candidatus Amesbacteria bacterium GW2011_GWC2_47_8]
MKIGFVNFTPLVYSVNTPYNEPLGGSESALCYLTEALAKRGHEVILFGRMPGSFTSRRVIHKPDNDLKNEQWQDLDFLIIQNTPYYGIGLKTVLGDKTKLVFWSQHAPDQPAVQSLRDSRILAAYDAIVMISSAQMEGYIREFGIDREKCFILRNAISPAFENLFEKEENILSEKSRIPVLVYTSTPFRGLGLLIKLFPQIRQEVPGTILKVFSSMKVYQTPKESDEKDYGQLYRLCQRTEGVEYVSSVSQTKLAKDLKRVLIFSYPNTFPETSCICAMEAMAAGCQVITSDLGALPETTAGFAKLIPMDSNYNQNFVDATVTALKNPTNTNKQVAFVKTNYTWKKRAIEWERWLKDLI